MTLRNYMIFWGVLTVALLGFIWLMGDVLLPFVVGMAIAYLLGPVMKKLVQLGVPRGIAALGILVGFFLVVVGVIALIVPFAYREAVQLANDLPRYADDVQTWMAPYIGMLQDRFQAGDLTAYQETLKNNIGKVLKFGADLLIKMVSGGQAVVGAVTFLVLTPIVAFFMIEEWVRITRWIDDMIPRTSYATIRGMLTEMDRKVSGFIRGQVMIALLLGLIYAVALSIAGLKFGFLIGLMAGLFSIIPLVGSVVGLVVSVAVAWFQSGELSYVAIIAAIFLIGQFVEGNIITPRIMGKSVGLHPLWILFALLAGGAMFGLVGMFLAVPVTAVIGVLGGFAIEQYRKSPYYGAGADLVAQPPVVDATILDVTAEKPAP